MRLVYPVHPRTKKRLRSLVAKSSEALTFTDPLPYFSFLKLEMDSKLILTDSGGVQEEACILKVPCVTLRTSTERQETIAVGANKLAGIDPQDILRSAVEMVDKRRDWHNPFGDGNAGKRIVDVVLNPG
jgi:UDP-N-acetylglucosamine 2-epimerase (non-hydrolysing)